MANGKFLSRKLVLRTIFYFLICGPNSEQQSGISESKTKFRASKNCISMEGSTFSLSVLHLKVRKISFRHMLMSKFVVQSSSHYLVCRRCELRSIVNIRFRCYCIHCNFMEISAKIPISTNNIKTNEEMVKIVTCTHSKDTNTNEFPLWDVPAMLCRLWCEQ